MIFIPSGLEKEEYEKQPLFFSALESPAAWSDDESYSFFIEQHEISYHV
jgi:hypothetical protein